MNLHAKMTRRKKLLWGEEIEKTKIINGIYFRVNRSGRALLVNVLHDLIISKYSRQNHSTREYSVPGAEQMAENVSMIKDATRKH
jgi:hypothetical protein